MYQLSMSTCALKPLRKSALATEKYLNTMAVKGSVQAFDQVMAKVIKRPPLPGDEMLE
jgi:hypothetical protein